MESDCECTDQSFELREEEMRRLDEKDQVANHMESELIYNEKIFEEMFEDELFIDEVDKHTLPIGFLDQSFEMFNDELKFLASADTCSTDNGDGEIRPIIEAREVSATYDWLIRRNRKKTKRGRTV